MHETTGATCSKNANVLTNKSKCTDAIKNAVCASSTPNIEKLPGIHFFATPTKNRACAIAKTLNHFAYADEISRRNALAASGRKTGSVIAPPAQNSQCCRN